MIAVTFCVASLIFFWRKLEINTPTTSFSSFMPVQILFFMVVFYLKFFLNIFYLIMFCHKHDINRSKSTRGLFWFRIKFEFIVLIMMSVLNMKFFTNEVLAKSEKNEKDIFQSFVFFKMIVEIILYFISVKVAYWRYIYQRYNSIWKKGMSMKPYRHMKEVRSLFDKSNRMRSLEMQGKKMKKVDPRKSNAGWK
jgi:hypothetical protein